MAEPTATGPSPRRRAARGLLVGYAGYAATAAVVLRTTAPARLSGFAIIAATCTLLAGAVSLLLVPAHRARGGRRTIIGLHAALIPAQFAFSVPSPITLLGLILSAAIMAVMGPRFRTLSRRSRRVWLTPHVGCSAAWLGLSLTMVVLSLVGVLSGDARPRHDAYRLMRIFDLVVVIPIVLAAIVTGLVVALFSRWGLTRHWWVLIKFTMSVSIPASAGYWQSWIRQLITATAQPAGAVPAGTAARLTGCLAVGIAFLVAATALSTYKPGGWTPWATRPDAAAVSRR